ncbi:STM4012 family radical SAM protein [Blastopirellula marina]|uniref:Coproporphyrinogen III oxidase n=1 Tax=Blastopirellula marina TaxID=124 RepID=A0A2S8FD84_9BACT|nr:STM4012 family radical SAM protein [Blastopirellula marina]PQO30131.1 coproporphyrinogen III oxidase [Blastopirellula marina]PTL42569.1 coproporphyrinogen III oxidase family protein [Blastopirellula marina]
MSSIDMPLTANLTAPYVAYAYSYPHKSSYGELTPAVSLDELWQQENRRNLFLYVHLPFCEMRCGFCNLFARAGGDDATYDLYLDSVERQARRMSAATVGDRSVARLALGGGTPTVLSAAQLDRLFQMLVRYFDADPRQIPMSVESSPKTASQEKLDLLRQWGVERVSIGVQSFVESEVHSIGRPQQSAEVHGALSRIKQAGFPVLNIDLIYGQPQQTLASWNESLDAALRYKPEEIFLYPLYVRPQTGLGRRDIPLESDPPQTIELYRAGRDRLLAAGYRQLSMRSFTLKSETDDEGPEYCCQSDGMLGLGAGARSYATRLHYSSRFAVQAAGVKTILDQWVTRTEEDFGKADWGIWLTEEERQRRFIIQSLLHYKGLQRQRFIEAFGLTPETRIPELRELIDADWIEQDDDVLRLTSEGMAMSDAIGPALYSASCREALEAFAAK